MKRIFLITLTAVMAFSCTLGPGYMTKYTDVTTFEYDLLEGVNYSEVFSADSTYYNVAGALGWNDLIFYEKVSPIDKSFLGGWKLSYQRSVGNGMNAEKPAGYRPSNFRSMGVLYGSSNRTYMVFCQSEDPGDMPERDIVFAQPKYGTCVPAQCLVNNTEAVYEAVKDSFKAGDRLMLKATGYLGGLETGSVELQMAAADTVVYSWTKMDLSSLGNIDAIDFELTCNRGGIPMNFCMDELTARIEIEIE